MGTTGGKNELHRELLAAYEQEHRLLSETWKTLESKAQATVTIAGIFLAAAFAYARESASFSTISRVALAAAILLLMASVVAALLALRLRTTALPPLGTFLELPVHDLTTSAEPEPEEELLTRMMLDRSAEWREAVRTLRDANGDKSREVWSSHILLATAVLVIACVTVTRLLA